MLHYFPNCVFNLFDYKIELARHIFYRYKSDPTLEPYYPVCKCLHHGTNRWYR